MSKFLRRFSPLAGLLLICAALCQGEAPATLTSVEQIMALTNAEAAKGIPVKLNATVTFPRPSEKFLFVMDAGFGMYVRFERDPGLQAGDRISLTGVTAGSFRPIVKAREIRFLAHGALPAPHPARFADLIHANWDSRYVQIEGRVLESAFSRPDRDQIILIRVKMDQGTVQGVIAHPGNLRPDALLGAEVRIQGVAAGAFDSRMQMVGVWMNINSASDVVVVHPAAVDPWSLPTVPFDQVVFAYRGTNDSQRVKVAGTLTYYEPGARAVIESQGRAILVETDSTQPLNLGAGVEAVGFPEISGGNVRLKWTQLRTFWQAANVQPRTINWEDASAGRYAFNLVAMEGEVVAVVRDARIDLFILESGGHLFSATLRHTSPDASSSNPTPEGPSVGSRIRISGICFVEAGNLPGDRLWFDLRMRSMQDVTVLREPDWWNMKRLAYATTLLSAAILVAVIWAGLLDRRLRRQNAILAKQSQEDAIRERRFARQELQRSHILELISSSEPLPEVLREIGSMVSSRLYGAACWFELNVETNEVLEAEDTGGQAVVYKELFAPDGTRLGLLLATPLQRNSSNSEISVAMSAGARLAELAIDTRRLYSDLRHRSEYDLLTDIPNRFSMERHLDKLMLGAGPEASIFGLIYVDLDRFKQINDRYGHRTGDLYLQAVTGRMKFQLRTGDLLARIGGDEFIALVPILRSRADAEEIALRLERCFDEPFEIEGYRFMGSASVGLAVYPEDGSTKEDLQRSADAAMYANKESKRHQEKMTEAMQPSWNEDPLL